MFHKERLSLPERFKTNLRNKVTAVALPLALFTPVASIVSHEEVRPNTSVSVSQPEVIFEGACKRGPHISEPPRDYRKVWFRGVRLNVRTRVMIERAESYANKMGVPDFVMVQGSYNHGVRASAGTHDGGGAADISIWNMNERQQDNAVKALRMAGFAAWERHRWEGFTPHIHAMAIGDKQETWAAKSQIPQYFAGRNGLANWGRDTAPGSVGRPIPSWAKKYGWCR